MEHYGFISLIPALVVLILALTTKKTFEPLVAGALVGFAILNKGAFLNSFLDTLVTILSNADIAWFIFVALLMGALIALLVKSGGAIAFGNFVASKAKSKKGVLIAAWLLGIVIFVDDFLNALTVSSAMKKATDDKKTSREMLAYVVDSTAAPVCILFPISTWAIFVATLLEQNGVAAPGEGVKVFISTIPFNFYGWVALILVPLVILGIAPKFGPMKRAEERAEKEGILAPPGSDAMNIGGDVAMVEGIEPKLYNFLVPILLLIFVTIFSDYNTLLGVTVAVIVTLIMYLAQNICTLTELMDTFFAGIKGMIFPIAIAFMGLVLQQVNDGLGLAKFVIKGVTPIMSGALLPAVAFAALALVTFATGSFWGVYAITLPIIIPLAQAMDVNIYLAIGAVISAGAFGSHACPYGDATVLSAAGAGCNNIDHVKTQIPIALFGGAIATVLYLIMGFVM